MLSFLKNHPFGVKAFFANSWMLTFAIPKEKIQNLIPECLQLDVLNDRWAFITVALVETKDLRPKGFPKMLGNNFFLIGYRVFVRYQNSLGKNLRGLFILKSETDKRMMKFFGNIFTHYKYTTTDINQVHNVSSIEISSKKSNFKFQIEYPQNENIALPEGSPFKDWQEARKFAGPLPFTFTYNTSNKSVLIIEGVRKNWNPLPIKILNYNFSFLNNMKLEEIRLANAFMVENIHYYWKKGKMEKWKKEKDFREF